MATLATMTTKLGIDASGFNKGLAQAEKSAQSSGSKIGGFFSNAFSVATGNLLDRAAGSIISGFGNAASAGFEFNNSMEQARAKINAFTKDGAKTEALLDQVAARAAQTPFAFDEMANAAAALQPVMRASGASFEELIGKAEVLAASNPAEGLTGATFALKEAAGGDFQSAIERFNLSRSYIQQLKDEGVPNLEIVGKAMEQLGLDQSLVANLAQTASGRMSTFKDTLTTLAGVATEELFTGFSSGLGDLQGVLDANNEQLTLWAETIGRAAGGALEWLISTALPAMFTGFQNVTAAVGPFIAAFQTGGLAGLLEQLRGISPILDPLITTFQLAGQAAQGFWTGLMGTADPAAQLSPVQAAFLELGTTMRDTIVPAMDRFTAWFNENKGTILEIATLIGGAVTGFLALNAAVQGTLGIGLGAVAMFARMGGAIQAAGGVISFIVGILGGPLTLAIGLVVAAGALLYMAWTNNWGGIQEKVAAAWAYIEPVLTQFGEFFSGTLLPAIQSFGEWFSTTFTPMFKPLGDFFTNVLLPSLAKLGSAFTAVLPAFEGVGAVMKQTFVVLMPFIEGAIKGLITVFMAVASIIGGVLMGALNILANMFGGILYAAVNIAVGVFKVIQGTIQVFVAIITGMVQIVSRLLHGDFAGAWQAAQTMVQNVGTGIRTIISGMVQAVTGLISGFIQTVQGFFRGLAQNIGATVVGMVSRVVSIFGTMPVRVIAFVVRLVTGAVSKFEGMATSFFNTAIKIGTNIINGIMQGIGDLAGKLASKVSGALTGAVAAGKRAMGIASPSKVAAEELGEPISEGVAEGIEKKSAVVKKTLAEQLTDAIKGAADAITSGIKALNLLKEYDEGSLFEDAIWGFAHDVQRVMEAMGDMASKWSTKALEHAQVFGESVGKVMSFIDDGVKGLTMLAEYDEGNLFEDAIWGFAKDVARVVEAIVDVAAAFKTEGLVAGAEFAENAGKMVALIGGSFEILQKLGGKVKAVSGLAIQNVVAGIVIIVNQLEDATENLRIDGVTRAAELAEQMGKMVGLVGGAVDVFAKVSDIKKQLNATQVTTLVDGIMVIVAQVMAATATINSEALDAAAAMADGLGRVIGVVGGAIDTFVKLGDVKMTEIPKQALTFLMNGIEQAVQLMAEISRGISEEMLTRAVEFSEGAGKVLEPITKAIDAFIKLKDFEGIPPKAMEALAAGIHEAVYYMGIIAAGLETKAVEAAVEVSGDLGAIFDAYKKGLDFILALKDYEGLAPDVIERFAADFYAFVNHTLGMVTFAEQAAAAGRLWADAVESYVADIQRGQAAIALLGGAGGVTGGVPGLPEAGGGSIDYTITGPGSSALGGGNMTATGAATVNVSIGRVDNDYLVDKTVDATVSALSRRQRGA